jgi:3',5'-cyclic AMP phosphodiesterase CpdA
MPTLLHLTDLHLSTRPEVDAYGDFKTEVIPPGDRASRSALLENTVHELATWIRTKPARTLDAVAITGDITYQSGEDGFQKLEKILSALGDLRPPANRIVVVPGNHDVSWLTEPGSEARYALFLKYVRAAGYITPLLDGIDIDAEGTAKHAIDPKAHLLHDPEQGWTLVPLNSSNYCGSLEGFSNVAEEALWNGIATRYTGDERKNIEKLLRKSRLYDVARFSPAQLRAVRRMLEASAKEPTVRIALLHHHLLPVNVMEEAKAFESILNLGVLRLFLNDNRFDVVLHGHKHSGHTYFDDIQLPETAGERQRVFVISGSALGLGGSSKETARLVDVVNPTMSPRIELRSVSVAADGAKVDIGDVEMHRLWRSDAADGGRDTFKVVHAANVHEAYPRLMDIFSTFGEGADNPVFYLVAHIKDPSDAAVLPPTYPEDFPRETSAQTRQQQFADHVKWWQLPTSRFLDKRVFTHGARISGQLTRVVKSLGVMDKSRAVITLLHPVEDMVDDAKSKFPAFCLAQFFVSKEGGVSRLNCVGYFREQEMRYWWAVNVAELRELQLTVQKKFNAKFSSVELGSITTIATVAICGNHTPRVAVPFIDRMVDMKKDTLWRNIYGLVRSEPATSASARAFWMATLDDLLPATEMPGEGRPMSIGGLEYVCEHLRRFCEWHDGVRDIWRPLENLKAVNARMRSMTSEDTEQYDVSREEAVGLITAA